MSSFDAEIARALASVGASPEDAALDPIAEPWGSIAELEASPERVLMRITPVLGKGGGGYGPEPREPVWIVFERGVKKAKTVSLRGDTSDSRSIDALRIESEEISCCDAPGCSIKKPRATAVIELGGDKGVMRLVLAEAIGSQTGRVTAVLRALGAYVGIDPKGDGPELSEEADRKGRAPLSARSLARYAVRLEGTRVVLRDYGSLGPRAGAGSKLAISAALAVVAGLLWAETARVTSAGGSTGRALGTAALAILVTLTAYAFFGVARFAAKYGARSLPRVAIGRDRIVVLPWLSRLGSVDERPEGRFGAAIPLGEVQSVSALQRDGAIAIEVASDHGPIDALTTDRDDVAELWRAVIERSIGEAAHPNAGASARQRARAKAKEATAKARPTRD